MLSNAREVFVVFMHEVMVCVVDMDMHYWTLAKMMCTGFALMCYMSI